MLIIKFILLVSLITISIQDFKDREYTAVILVPVIISFGLIRYLSNVDSVQIFLHTFINILITAIHLIGLKLWGIITKKENRQVFGEGDGLFLIAFTPLFSPFSFTSFILVSFIIVIIISIIIGIKRSIPLAGWLSFFLFCLLLSDIIFPGFISSINNPPNGIYN